jgi:hypothetical protein
MEQSKTIHLIACGVLAPDMKRIAAQLNIPLTMTFLPGGLHNQPVELGQRLQQAIDEAGQVEECERIVIGYGICGRGTVGIKAPHVLKKQLFKDISEEEAERSPVVRQLLLQILKPEKPSGNSTFRYRLKAELHHPVIGIGAPVQYFLPQAGKLVNTEVIIPSRSTTG